MGDNIEVTDYHPQKKLLAGSSDSHFLISGEFAKNSHIGHAHRKMNSDSNESHFSLSGSPKATDDSILHAKKQVVANPNASHFKIGTSESPIKNEFTSGKKLSSIGSNNVSHFEIGYKSSDYPAESLYSGKRPGPSRDETVQTVERPSSRVLV